MTRILNWLKRTIEDWRTPEASYQQQLRDVWKVPTRGDESNDAEARATAASSHPRPRLVLGNITGDPLRVVRRSAGGRDR